MLHLQLKNKLCLHQVKVINVNFLMMFTNLQVFIKKTNSLVLYLYLHLLQQ